MSAFKIIFICATLIHASMGLSPRPCHLVKCGPPVICEKDRGAPYRTEVSGACCKACKKLTGERCGSIHDNAGICADNLACHFSRPWTSRINKPPGKCGPRLPPKLNNEICGDFKDHKGKCADKLVCHFEEPWTNRFSKPVGRCEPPPPLRLINETCGGFNDNLGKCANNLFCHLTKPYNYFDNPVGKCGPSLPPKLNDESCGGFSDYKGKCHAGLVCHPLKKEIHDKAGGICRVKLSVQWEEMIRSKKISIKMIKALENLIARIKKLNVLVNQ